MILGDSVKDGGAGKRIIEAASESPGLQAEAF